MSKRPRTLPKDLVQQLVAGLPQDPVPEPIERQPLHVVYGGAHLFKAETPRKLGALAKRTLDTFAPNAASFARAVETPEVETVHARVLEKLAAEPVEDYRIDFEDGYGVRSDDEEDAHATAAAQELARGAQEGTLPPSIGLRIKPMHEERAHRALRTLDLFLTRCAQESINQPLSVTLPKVPSRREVSVLNRALDEMESSFGWARGTVSIEIMVEHPTLVLGPLIEGVHPLRAVVAAADGRCSGAHFGPYDYLTELGIAGSVQSLHHPACHFARRVMQVVLAGTGIRLSDGPTKVLPLAPHRGDALSDAEQVANRHAVHQGWAQALRDVSRSLHEGFHQGWDLHPAQLPVRYAAVFLFFRQSLDDAGARLRSFLDASARASTLGARFDDASSAQGLLVFLRQAIACGAVSDEEAAAATGIDAETLRTTSLDQLA
ncbi:MAG: phosphoenolpyruvate kinase [Planctomycetota bacterium]